MAKAIMPIRPFDYSLDYTKLDFSQNPELYRIGRGEQGVLLVEPYKSQILPYWRFKTVAEARKSSRKIYEMFLDYLADHDFVGADMARKFLQMGWTRARRYSNYEGGRKFDKETKAELPRSVDKVKSEAAAIFYRKYVQARENKTYCRQRSEHRRMFES
jgi:hypothetical protein